MPISFDGRLTVENAILSLQFTVCSYHQFIELFHIYSFMMKQELTADDFFSDASLSPLSSALVSLLRQLWPATWQVLADIPSLITSLVQQFPQIATDHVSNRKFREEGSIHFENAESIFIGEGTRIEHGSWVAGPCIIGKNCTLRAGSYIRGNAIIGEGTLIGNSCEVKNSLVMDRCQIAHFNYIGDSILGAGTHFSAGAITSNLKFDQSVVKAALGPQTVETKLHKFGALTGEDTEIGCNSVLNPGSIVAKKSIIYPLVNFRGTLPPAHICKLSQTQTVVERL